MLNIIIAKVQYTCMYMYMYMYVHVYHHVHMYMYVVQQNKILLLENVYRWGGNRMDVVYTCTCTVGVVHTYSGCGTHLVGVVHT